MSDRGDEEQKGPIRRYGRRGDRYRRGPRKRSDHAQSADTPPLDTNGGEPTPAPTPLGTQPTTLGTPPTIGTPPEKNFTIPTNFPPPSAFQIQTVTSSSRFSGSGLRWLIIGITTIVVIVAVAIPVISVSNTLHDVTPLFQHNTPAPTTQSAAPTNSQPAHQASYLTTPGLRAGLARIAHTAPGAKVALVRIAEDSLSATVKLPNGNIKELIFNGAGSFTVSIPTLGERAIPISQVRPRAIARIIAGMRARFHVPARRIDYIVLSTPSGVPSQWIVFSTAPGHPGYTATLDGTKLARLPG